MAKLNDKQKRFIDGFKKRCQKANIFELVICNLFYVYLVAEKETDRENAAFLLYSLKDEYKECIKIWDLLDDDFETLLESYFKRIREQSKQNQKRRHDKRNDFALSDDEWRETIEFFNYRCAYCGKSKKLTYDHFLAFSKGGSFKKDNIIPCCSYCNSSKHDRDFETWYLKKSFFSKERYEKVKQFIEINRLEVVK